MKMSDATSGRRPPQGKEIFVRTSQAISSRRRLWHCPELPSLKRLPKLDGRGPLTAGSELSQSPPFGKRTANESFEQNSEFERCESLHLRTEVRRNPDRSCTANLWPNIDQPSVSKTTDPNPNQWERYTIPRSSRNCATDNRISGFPFAATSQCSQSARTNHYSIPLFHLAHEKRRTYTYPAYTNSHSFSVAIQRPSIFF